MLLCFGWAIVQVSRKAYTAPMSPAEIDELDYRTAAEDQKLHADCRSWLEANANDWLKWQFFEASNNHTGLLQFNTSRNHRTSSVSDLLNFLTAQSKGTYGLVYIHDDEDPPNEYNFRVWRLRWRTDRAR